MKRVKTGGVFISYRRQDTDGAAGHLYADLKKHFGDDSIFMDSDIPSGVPFGQYLEETLDSCKALIALIGRNWLTKDAKEHRRIDDPEDWVRLEIATALRRKIRVFPVLVEEATMPKVSELPGDLTGLAAWNAHNLRNKNWEIDVGGLIRELEKVVFPWRKWLKRLLMCVVAAALVVVVLQFIRPDAWIVKRVEAALARDPMTKGLTIRANSRKGIISLVGEFETEAQSNAVVSIVRRTSGVKEVNPDGLHFSDIAIEQNVRRALEAHPRTKGLQINVQVQAGVATLSGTVRLNTQKNAVQDIASRVPGVTKVVNDVRVTE